MSSAIKHIQVVSYDPNWPAVYEEEAVIIKRALDDNFVEIHHIGSTAVEGLSSKPKIDIIAKVKNGKLSINQLEKVGFCYKGEWNIPSKFGFTKRDKHKVNLHVFEGDDPEIELNILFRDHLRSNPESLKQYASIKEMLILDKASFEKQKGSVFSGYNLGKDSFIRRILSCEGYKGLRFLKVTHVQEWQDYHRIIKSEIFNQTGQFYDTSHTNVTLTQHHFILCCGTEVVTIAHVELIDETSALLKYIATDSKFQIQGYGKHMIKLLVKWLKKHEVKSLEIHQYLRAKSFFEKVGFVKMPTKYMLDNKNMLIKKI